MRYLFFIACLFVSLAASSQASYSIDHSSFNPTGLDPASLPTLRPGTQQWVDVDGHSIGALRTTDTFKLYLSHVSIDSAAGRGNIYTSYSNTTVVYQIAFWRPDTGPCFWNLPKTSDSLRRIYFTIPADFEPDTFAVSTYINTRQIAYWGILANTTGIEPTAEASDAPLSIRYYTFTGQQLDRPQGLYIEERVYENGQCRRKKRFLTAE